MLQCHSDAAGHAAGQRAVGQQRCLQRYGNSFGCYSSVVAVLWRQGGQDSH